MKVPCGFPWGEAAIKYPKGEKKLSVKLIYNNKTTPGGVKKSSIKIFKCVKQITWLDLY